MSTAIVTTFEERIDALDVEQMLRKWRFAPIGAFVKGEPETEYFVARMARLRAENPRAYTLASKEIGW